MDNTLYDGERLVLNVRAYDNKAPSYKYIQRDSYSVKYLIKRVIGTPGDKMTKKIINYISMID